MLTELVEGPDRRRRSRRCRRRSCSTRSGSRSRPSASSARCSGSASSRSRSTRQRARRCPRSGARRAARSRRLADGRGRGLPARGASAGHRADRRGRPLLSIGVYNCDGELYALEDRCSHDDGPLCEGDFDCGERVVVCPRHGARFDIATGRGADPAGLHPGRDVSRFACGTTAWSSSTSDSPRPGRVQGLPSSTGLGIHVGLPRKGGGPDVTDSSSTGSGGTSG